MFEREKKTDCGNYREVDVIPRTDNAEKAVRGKRGKRKKVTEPKQKVILSILVDTFFTRIFMLKLQHPEIHNISVV